MRARLLCDYRTPYANPIRLQPGQVVALGVRDEEWPAFAWVRVDGGQAGWAPVDWLRPLGDGRAEALRAYDARELEADFAGPAPDLSGVEGVTSVEPTPEGVRLRLTGPPAPVLAALAAAGVVAVRTREASLEEIFLAYYGEADDDPGEG